MFGEDEIVRSHKHRADAIVNIIFLAFGLLLARLWYLQVYRGDLLYKYSQENRLRKEVVSAPRGMVFSRNNQVLIHNVPRFDVVITPQYLSNKKETIGKLASILEMTEDQIDKVLKKNSLQASYRPVTIKKNVSRREVAVIETEGAKIPGVSVKSVIAREYTDENIGSHLMGYISEISPEQLPNYKKRDKFDYKLGDFIGQAGIEYEFDLSLRGIDGHEFMEVDAFGRMNRHVDQENLFTGIDNQSAVAGQNIRLTVDRDLQITAYQALEEKNWVGGAVAVDVTNGEVLAMVSRPSYSPSVFSRGLSKDYWTELTKDSRNPMRDRTIQEHFMPGSTFKTITAIAALEEGVVDRDTEVNCPGWFQLGKRRFHCWKKHGHGNVSLFKAIRESCDVYFYKIATKMDIDVLAKYSKALGFGALTRVKLPRETPGLIPTKEWKLKRTGEEWQKGETLSCVIGQGFVLTTPIQLAMAYAAIGNGGTLYQPHLVKEIFSNEGEVIKRFDPDVVRSTGISKQTLKLINEGLYQVVNNRNGTAWWYKGQGIEMAGKTGTSQVVRFSADKIYSKCEDYPYNFRHHGLFIAYAPARDPKIAVSVVVEHGCHGSSAAAPIARAIITKYMEKYHPELQKQIAAEEKAKYQAELRQAKAKESEEGDE